MPVVMPEPTSKNALHGQTFMLDFSYPQNHLPPTSPADFKNRTPIPYPSTTSLEPKRPRPFPTLAEVNDTTITECYIRYIIASDPNRDDSAYTTYQLARKFTAVPRTEGKVFKVWELFKLVSQLDGGKIKNWSQLVGKLGVEDRTGRPQYAQRVKRWMQSNKIDEFFDFLLRGDQRISSIAVRTPVTDYLLYHPHSQYPADYPTATVHPQNYSICEDRRRSFDVQFGVHASVHPKKRMRTSFDSHFSSMPVFSNGNYTSYHQGPSRQFAHRSDCALPPLRKTTARSRSPTLNSDGTFTVSPVLEPSLNFSLPVPRLPTSPYSSPVLGSCAEFPSPLIPGLTASRRFEDSYAPYSHEIRASIPASSDVEPLRTRIMKNEQKTVELRRLLEDANREKVILKEREDLQKLQQFQTFDPRRIR